MTVASDTVCSGHAGRGCRSGRRPAGRPGRRRGARRGLRRRPARSAALHLDRERIVWPLTPRLHLPDAGACRAPVDRRRRRGPWAARPGRGGASSERRPACRPAARNRSIGRGTAGVLRAFEPPCASANDEALRLARDAYRSLDEHERRRVFGFVAPRPRAGEPTAAAATQAAGRGEPDRGTRAARQRACERKGSRVMPPILPPGGRDCRIGCSSSCNGEQSRSTPPRASRCSPCCASSSASSRVKDGCAPQGQCGCCTVLVDGEPGWRASRRSRRVAGRSVTTVDGLDPARTRRARGAFVATGGVAVRLLHARASSCARPRCRAKGRTAGRRRPRARRAPLPVHRLADDLRGDRRRAERARRRVAHARRGRASAPSSRAARRSGRAPTCRSATAGSPTTPRPATRWSRCRARRDRTPRTSRRRASAGSSPSRCSTPRALAGKVQGRRTTVDARAAARRCRRCPTVACASPRAGSSPRTSSPTRRGARPGGEPATPLANGGAFGGKAASLGRPRRRVSSPTSTGGAVRVRVLTRGRRAARAEAAADRRDARSTVDGVVRIDGAVVGRRRAVRRADRRGRTTSTRCADVDDGARCRDRRPRRHLRAVGTRGARACSLEGALDAAGVDRAGARARRTRRAAVLLDTCRRGPTAARSPGPA